MSDRTNLRNAPVQAKQSLTLPNVLGTLTALLAVVLPRRIAIRLGPRFASALYRTQVRRLGHQKGFTLVEVVLSLSIFSVLAVSVFAIVPNYLATITRNNLQTDMTIDSQNLLRATVEELRYGAGVRQTNTIADPHAPVGGWNTGNANFVIIIAVPAVDSNRQYIIDTTTGNPYNNELVYFKQGSNLYKRTLAHPSATGNSLRTSCPSASATPTCPADRLLNEMLEDMNFTFYNQDDAVTADPLLARSVKIDLYLERDTFGEPLTIHNSIRVALRNSFL